MRWLHSFFAPASLSLAALLAAPAPVLAQGEALTKEGIISGGMNIEFKTRTNLDTSGDLKSGSAAVGVQDVYTFSLNCADTVEFAGKITRQPNLYSKLIAKKKQEAQLFFDVGLSVFNPKDLKQKRAVGKFVGTVPIDTASGHYDLAGGSAKESPLRIQVDAVGSAAAFSEPFTGRLVGKAEKKESLAQYTFKRVVGNRTVEIKVKKSDPMRFDNIKLAKGPATTYPNTYVSGRLDYDYETGNWYTDGIRFKYTLDGKDFEDIVTGSIKWVEDPDRKTNGKGRYEFNLRWNEEKNKPAATEAAAFDKMNEEDAFFAVDDTVPCLTGTIDYVDTYASGGGDEPVPASSKVTYKLNANKLTKQQVMSFFKLWLVCTGPTNDE